MSSSAPTCSERGRYDPDHAAVGAAGEERKRRGELDNAEDDRDPAPRVQTRENVLCVGGEECRVTHGGDAVNEVEDTRHQQQDAHEQRPALASHKWSFRTGRQMTPRGRFYWQEESSARRRAIRGARSQYDRRVNQEVVLPSIGSDAELKARHRAMWASGDYPSMVETFLLPLGPRSRRGVRRRRRGERPRRRRRDRQRRDPRGAGRRGRHSQRPDARAVGGGP